MNTRVSFRDYETLSAYLDGQLKGKDLQKVQARLVQDDLLRTELTEMRRMRTVLRSLPRQRAPRNFTLTPAMVGIKPPRSTRLYPVMGFASALASLLFVLMVLGDFLGFIPSSLPQGSGPAAVQESAPLALVLTDESPVESNLQMKNAAPVDEPAVMEAYPSLGEEASRIAPTDEAAALTLQSTYQDSTAQTEALELPPSAAEDSLPAAGMGGGIITETLMVPDPNLIPTLPVNPYDSILSIEVSAIITATSTPTPMPTETPLPTAISEGILTATSTPTPMPTETPLPQQKALVEEQPTSTPTAEALAKVEAPVAGEAGSEIYAKGMEETSSFLPEEEGSQPDPIIRPVLLIQVGLLALAFLTGAAFLFLRFKER